MAYPEGADLIVGIGKGKAFGRLGMAEEGGVEIQAHVVLLGKLYPLGKVLGLQLVAVDRLAIEDGVDGVKIDLLFAGDQLQSDLQIGHQLFGSAGLAGIVAGGLDTAGEGAAQVFKTDNVIALPAMHTDGDVLQNVQRFFGIDTEFFILFACRDIPFHRWPPYNDL